MNPHRISAGALALAALLFFAGCGKSGDTDPVTDTDTTAAAGGDTAEDYTTVQPDEGSRVDIGRWHDMTRADFENLYTDFALGDPPMIRGYGICDSVAVFFPDDSPEAMPEILICDLDGVYTVEDAFAMLGIEINEARISEGQWISIVSPDERFLRLQYRSAGEHADRTTQLLLQFSRTLHKE